MLDTIKNAITDGWGTLKGLLTLEWLNFKNWKKWTSLRTVYFAITVYMILGILFNFFGGIIWCAMYFAVCCFFKVEPVMWILGLLGFEKTDI